MNTRNATALAGWIAAALVMSAVAFFMSSYYNDVCSGSRSR
jgi:hypothetical protein